MSKPSECSRGSSLYNVNHENIADRRERRGKKDNMDIYSNISVRKKTKDLEKCEKKATKEFKNDSSAMVKINSAVSSLKRSEERRVGKECLRLCRSRWSPYH